MRLPRAICASARLGNDSEPLASQTSRGLTIYRTPETMASLLNAARCLPAALRLPRLLPRAAKTMTPTSSSQPPAIVDEVAATDSAMDSRLDAVAGRLDGPEIANSITHGLGLALSLVAAAIILVSAA